jgi:hypothetical protein
MAITFIFLIAFVETVFSGPRVACHYVLGDLFTRQVSVTQGRQVNNLGSIRLRSLPFLPWCYDIYSMTRGAILYPWLIPG